MPRELETAIVLVLTRQSPELSALSRQYHPKMAAMGIPLHITLLSPFVARPSLTPEVIESLRSFFGARAPLSFELTRIAEFPGVLYAVPEPAGELVELIDALARAFPDTPPYGGAFDEPVPHATLAEAAPGDGQQHLAAELRAATAELLPVRCEVTHASLLEEYAPERWRERRRFPFTQR